MAYYVSKIVWHCPKCQKLATHEVKGHRNESYGKFCEKHAEQKASELRAKEES